MALVPEPSLRLNKAITMQGIQAAGLHAGLLVEGGLGALVHSSHDEFRERLFAIQRSQGMKAYLDSARRTVPARADGAALRQGTAQQASRQMKPWRNESLGD